MHRVPKKRSNKNCDTHEKDIKKQKDVKKCSTEDDQDAKSNKNNIDSSDISDIEDNQSISDAFNYDLNKSNEENEETQKEYMQTVVLEKVVQYIKIDDIIKNKQQDFKKEMKIIKDTKEKLEQFLIDYLDKINEEYIQIGNKSTLVKTEVRTKAPPKMEDIGACLIEGFKKYELCSNNDEEIKKIIGDFVTLIDDKREIKSRKYLKRKNNNKTDEKKRTTKTKKNNVKYK